MSTESIIVYRLFLVVCAHHTTTLTTMNIHHRSFDMLWHLLRRAMTRKRSIESRINACAIIPYTIAYDRHSRMLCVLLVNVWFMSKPKPTKHGIAWEQPYIIRNCVRYYKIWKQITWHSNYRLRVSVSKVIKMPSRVYFPTNFARIFTRPTTRQLQLLCWARFTVFDDVNDTRWWWCRCSACGKPRKALKSSVLYAGRRAFTLCLCKYTIHSILYSIFVCAYSTTFTIVQVTSGLCNKTLQTHVRCVMITNHERMRWMICV